MRGREGGRDKRKNYYDMNKWLANIRRGDTTSSVADSYRERCRVERGQGRPWVERRGAVRGRGRPTDGWRELWKGRREGT